MSRELVFPTQEYLAGLSGINSACDSLFIQQSRHAARQQFDALPCASSGDRMWRGIIFPEINWNSLQPSSHSFNASWHADGTILVCDIHYFIGQYSNRYAHIIDYFFTRRHNNKITAFIDSFWTSCIVIFVSKQARNSSAVLANLIEQSSAGLEIKKICIVVESGANVTIHDVPEFYDSLSFMSMEFWVEQSAHVTLKNYEHLPANAIRFRYLAAHVEKHSTLIVHKALSGGALSSDWFVVDLGEFATITFRSIIALQNAEQHAISIAQLHEHQSARSDIIVAGVLTDSARASYDGAILIGSHAANSTAHQQAHYMLLSDTCSAHTHPCLEIKTNTVTCGHATSVGYLDADQCAYLHSRGCTNEVAQQLLVAAFFASRTPDVFGDPTSRMHDALNSVTFARTEK